MIKKNNTLVWQFYNDSNLPNNRHDEATVESPSYIIGTMHVRDERAFQCEQVFLDKIRASEVFATEFDLEDTHLNSVENIMLLNDNQTLTSLIPPKLYGRINKVLKKQAGVELMQFDRFKPIAITNFLTLNILSNDRLLSLDETLWHFAKDNGKILRGIETFEEQLDILNSLPIDAQIKSLKDITKNFSKFRKQLVNMAKIYEQADIVKLYKLSKKTAKGNKKTLIYDRNEIMADRIISLSKQNTVCVAIGAGHLAGKKGLLRLLKQKGYIVKPA